MVLNDGFDRSARLSDAFAFAPERYFDRTYRSGSRFSHASEIPTINLVKLHGSMSWRRRPDRVVFSTTFLPNLTNADRNDPAKVRDRLEKYFLILPNLRKFNTTLMERVYYDLLRILSGAMEHENAVLMSFGFSFQDDHILDIIKRCLRNPTSQLIVFSYDHASVAGYEAKFAKHRNVTVVGPKPGANVDFPRLNALLTAVLPISKRWLTSPTALRRKPSFGSERSRR